MKTKNTIIASLLVFNFLHFTTSNAQERPLSPAQNKQLQPFTMKDYQTFKKEVKPLIQEMGLKKIVGLGEGTHGTAEFYTVRYYITRMLIEDYGFNHVAFENDLTEVWQFNQQLSKTNDLNALIKKYFLSLWQNEETKQLFQWIISYNATHKKQVTVNGIDFPAQQPDVDMLIALLDAANITSFSAPLEVLKKSAFMQDEAWSGMNKKDAKTDWNLLAKHCRNEYITADSLETAFKALNIDSSLKNNLLLAIGNLKQGCEPFFREIPEGARDSIMAYNTARIVKNENDKVVIWAHNAHLGKTGIYDNVVGGTGGYILKLFPGNYFALGTGTALGTFGGTTDARAVNNSPIAPYPLENPITGSWEELLSSAKTPDFYFDTDKFNPAKELKPLRFIGFGTKSGASSYDKTNLRDLFDAFIFLNQTHAPTPLKEDPATRH